MLQNAARDRANDRGFVFTSKGRRLRFPNGWKTYKASGLLIQATAADWNKENIVWASQYCKEFGGGARLVLNTHDSYSFSVPPEGMREFWEGLKTRLESSDRSNVPLLLDLSGIGDNWWEAVSGAGYEHASGELK